MFSHLHYDHIGDPSRFAADTKFIIGPVAKDLICGAESYPQNLKSHHDSQLLPMDRTMKLPGTEDRGFWRQLGPFPDAHDYFGDGSAYIVNFPGHCVGHMNLLVQNGSKWVLLAGDATHDRGILDDRCRSASYIDEATGALRHPHHDPRLAEDHLGRVRAFARLEDAEVILAHDHTEYGSICCRYGPEKECSDEYGELLRELER